MGFCAWGPQRWTWRPLPRDAWMDWEFQLSPWDLAAGALLVEEAGGRVTTPLGDPLPPLGTEIVATNGLIHTELLEVLARCRAAIV